jgi:hypothetical protein
MNIKKTLNRASLPERDAFYTALHTKLFPHAPEEKPARSKFWSLSLATSSLTFAIVAGFIVYNVAQPKGIVLAAAITNTLQFTKSSELLQQTIHIRRHVGQQSTGQGTGFVADAEGNIVPPSEDSDDVTTTWLYQDNVRTDKTVIDDNFSYSTSSLVSDVEKVTCQYDGSDKNSKPTCSASGNEFSSYFKSFTNGNGISVQNPRLEHSNDPQGDVHLIWETDQLLRNPIVAISTGPSGYQSTWFNAYSSKNDEDTYTYRINMFSDGIRLNAENAFYPSEESATFYAQFTDDSNTSIVYLANINNNTLIPVSDAELEKSRERYAVLAQGFQTSTNALDQDMGLAFGNITYLKNHESELILLDQEKVGKTITYTYAIPKSLRLYGGTNNALITKASFTINQSQSLVTEYHFFDEDGVDVENATITRVYPDTDPSIFFTQEYWKKSLISEN